MNKLKIRNSKQKLVLTDIKDRAKVARESENGIKIPFMISSLKNEQTAPQEADSSKGRVSGRDKRSNSSLLEQLHTIDGLENSPIANKKRVRAPSRFQ